MGDILFKNATIITMNGSREILSNAYLLTNKTKIKYVGNTKPKYRSASTREIDCSNLLLMPGLVNAHTHSPMTLLRGLSDDCSLQRWLNDFIWPAESNLTREDIYVGCLLGIAEMLRYGITSFTDMYRFSETLAEAAVNTGIKANICESIVCTSDSYDPKNHNSTQEAVRLIDNWQNYDLGRIKCDTSIQSEFQTCQKLWDFISDFAFDKQIGIHMHLSETREEVDNCLRKYGKSATQLFYEAGVFRSRAAASHCIYLNENDMDIFRLNHASVVHDPCSNLKMCCGFANLKPLKEKGINISLGTDGVCSNNSGDLFETMKFTALNQKMITNDPTFMSAYDTLYCATMGGLISQGRQNESGILESGRDADIIALDLKTPGLLPCINPISNAVYSANGNHVFLTMVRGAILYENGNFYSLDMEFIRNKVAGFQ